MKNRIKSLLLVGILSGQLCAGDASRDIQAQDGVADVAKAENVTLRGRMMGHCMAFGKKISRTAGVVVNAVKASPVIALWGAAGAIILAEMCARMVRGPVVTKAEIKAALREALTTIPAASAGTGAAAPECSICCQGMINREGCNRPIGLTCCAQTACLACLRKVIVEGLDKTRNPFPCPFCRAVFNKDDVHNIVPQRYVQSVERIISRVRR